MIRDRAARALVASLGIVALAACIDELPQQTSRIDAPRVIAVVADPAEAPPGAAVTYAAIVAAPDGPRTDAVAWSYCTAPKPPTEDNIVPPACLDNPDWLVPLGAGASVTATIPADACRLYGPDTPPGGFRPRDPDPSGGYYQPVRAAYDGAPLAFGLHRLACNLADAPPAIVREFRERYPRNTHPSLASFRVLRDGAPIDPAALTAGEPLTLEATWPAAAVEPYVVYDRARVAVVPATETLRVGWFATAGALAADATGGTTAATVAWTAPTTAGPVHLWAVLHDERGGVATATFTATIR